ncbi:hypothetical protein HRG_011444 [Hirsutella rhossiliensis]|uniref:Uncharacterized protein n=1 Tax=Hirsutella rhossiliensis TaxID=111463 RepID=A0A9P8MQC6_9HYPO|nr:uncharacterized protein HRG_11444 [Hirsutella rhossiliensis]KAH0957297.1 hypothetical protein HRG_11444 [Hirsutella rhossiliensis]
MSALDAPASAPSHVGTGSTTDDDSFTPPRENTASGVRPGPLPPLQSLPGPDGTHKGWDATTVSTAKCDMCHKQRCGTIQKCSECKLSVCMDCAVADRLRGDARHALDPEAVDWTGPLALSKLRRLRASRTARVGGVRHGTARALRTHARGRRRRAPPCPVPSRATSTSFSSPATPLTDVVFPALDDDDDAWDEGYGCWGDEKEQGVQPIDEAAAAAAAALYHRPVGHATKAASPVSAQTAHTEDAAEILAQMPRRRTWSAAEQQQNPRLYGSTHSVLLPPVRSVPDPRQSGLLPPLRTLHPQLGVENAQLQPLMPGNSGPLLPRPVSSWTYARHVGIAEDTQQVEDGASSYDCHRTQGYSSWDVPPRQQQQQRSHAYQDSTTAASYSNENEEPNHYGTLPAASTAHYSTQEPPAIPRVTNFTNFGESFTDYMYKSCLPPRHDGRTQSYDPSTGYPPAEYQPTTMAPRAGAYEPSPTPAGPSHEPPRPTVHEQGAILKSATLAIQAAEHLDWPLDWCLQLALARTWAQRIGEEPRADGHLHAFLELRAAAYVAALDLDLPERHNAARAWLCERQHTLEDGEGVRFPASNVPLPLGFFEDMAGRGDFE